MSDKEKSHDKRVETVTLGGGCFWCMEAVFDQVEGVIRVESGYSGGDAGDAKYDRVSTGKTGHAEVVQVIFDPNAISFEEVLDVFFTAHDPTTLNRQGEDVGPQYRSVIFHHNEKQRSVAEEMINNLNRSGAYDSPVITELRPFVAFYKAESYHDDYYKQHPGQPYCRLVIFPKLDKVRSKFDKKIKPH